MGAKTRIAAAVIILALLVPVFAFGRAVSEGYYFGACDNAKGETCYITHVLGVVMRRDGIAPNELSAQHYREEEERAGGRPQREREAEERSGRATTAPGR